MKKILILVLSICAVTSLSACDGEFTKEDKEINEYYQYLDNYVEATSDSTRTIGKSFGKHTVNDVIGDYTNSLYDGIDYMDLVFYRRSDVVFNSVTFTITAQKDVTLHSFGLQAKGYKYGEYKSAYVNVFDVDLEADIPQTFTLDVSNCSFTNGGSNNDISITTLPSATSKENRMFTLFFRVYMKGTNKTFLDNTSLIENYDLGIRFSNISFDFELEE